MQRRQKVLFFLVLLAVITFLDRISISVAAARIQHDLGISTSLWGWISGAFVISYGLFEIPTGALGDRIGARKVLTRVVLWWTTFTAFTGLTWNFGSLLVTRFLFGIGEAGAYPNISLALAQWFPQTGRARAQGFVWGASRFGGALAPLVVAPLQRWVGWRMTFVLLGAVGAVWAACWYGWYREPREGRPAERIDWRELLASKQMRLLFAMYFFYGWGPWFYFSWYPLYLMKEGRLSETQMGVFSALPYLLGVVANLGSGAVFDRITERRGIRYAGRLVGPASLAGAACLMILMTRIEQQAWLVAVSALGFGVVDCMVPAAWAVAMNMGGERAGTVTGAMNTAGQLGGFVCSVLAGYLVQATGGYKAPVLVVAAVLMVAAVLFAKIDGSKSTSDV